VMRSSMTGSLKPPPKEDPAAVPRGSQSLIPKP
jgi:hypothetical protein